MTREPLWYKDAILYEVPIRAYYDAAGTGGGDFAGLTQKLDYLEDLGVTAIWILPFYPSPLKDDGYDIADYTSVNPIYGTLDDFKHFLDEAHRRGLHVITELVINHTSDQHPWFQRARHASRGSPERDFYVWSDTPDRFANVPLMFPEFESSNWTWDPVAQQYFWHRFYRHQPDLNFDNPAVWDALFPVVDFWMDLGVDGMRLDAVPYLFEREGTLCEHLPETHTFLKALRRHTDEKYPNRMFLAEANAWPEDAVTYFGDGDECQMAFHFPLMPRLYMALQQEDRFPITDIFAQTPPIPETAQWCLFLRNHDELTLAMVTDEERDSMMQAYARESRAKLFLGIRHRLAPLMRNDRRRIELMNALLLSLPGSPVIYYGDEIGMGDNIYLGDRNGVRTPMQWSADRNAGFSRANPQKLYLPIILDPEYHYEAVNVESQQNNPSSLLWWMKRLIALRKQRRSLSRGSIEFLKPGNTKVLAFLREFEGETILVIANLSRFVQHAEVDLARFAGWTPEEMQSHGRFPAISHSPYPLTLGPHGYYWFVLHPVAAVAEDARPVPAISAPGDAAELFRGVHRDDLEAVLPRILPRIRPFETRGPILSARIVGSVRLQEEAGTPVDWTALRIDFQDGPQEIVQVPFAVLAQDAAEQSRLQPLAKLTGGEPRILAEATTLQPCLEPVLQLIVESRRKRTATGMLAGFTTRDVDVGWPADESFHVKWDADGNAIATFASHWQLKLLRALEDGDHPEFEVARLFAGRECPGLALAYGGLEFHRTGGGTYALAILRQLPDSQVSAWEQAHSLLSHFFERATAMTRDNPAAAPDLVELFTDGEAMADRLGLHLATLHQTLVATNEPAFAPTPFSRTYQRSIYQSIRTSCDRLIRDLNRQESHSDSVSEFLEQHAAFDRHFQRLNAAPLDGTRIRCHGDYHLGRLIVDGDQYWLADFDGEPDRSLGNRGIKRSPLRDLVSMLRSLDYAATAALQDLSDEHGRAPGIVREVDRPHAENWLRVWLNRVSQRLITSYTAAMAESRLLPSKDADMKMLLNLFQMDRALLEAQGELRRRPEWVDLPIRALLRLHRGEIV